MMGALGEYILSVTISAIGLGIFSMILDPKAVTTVLIKFIGSVFFVFVLIQPVKHLNIPDFQKEFMDFTQKYQDVVRYGEGLSRSAASDIIIRETETYILDKAGALELDIDVLVTVGEGAIPIPAGVEVLYSGSESKRLQLQTVIEEDLDISKENQRWIRRN